MYFFTRFFNAFTLFNICKLVYIFYGRATSLPVLNCNVLPSVNKVVYFCYFIIRQMTKGAGFAFLGLTDHYNIRRILPENSLLRSKNIMEISNSQ